MIVHRVGEMVGRYAVGFQDDMVDIVFGDVDRALDHIVELEFVRGIALRTVAEHECLAVGNLGFHLFERGIAPDCKFAVITGC